MADDENVHGGQVKQTGGVAKLRLFASARVAAGTGHAEFDEPTVATVLAAASARFGVAFAEILPHCRVWLNGEPAEPQQSVGAADEVAVLPPVSGG